MDINEVAKEAEKDERIAVVTIYQRNGEPYLGADGKEVTISVVGSESKRYRQAKDASQRKMLRSRAVKLEPEDLRRQRIELAASAIVDWSGWEASDVAWPFNAENAKALLRTEHILDQVEVAIATHADFFTPSLPSSQK